MPQSAGPGPQAKTYNYDQWSRIKSLFDHALSLAPSERDAWLAGACQGEATLLENVMQLLKDYGSAGDFLQPSPVAPSQAFPENTVLAGRFRIVRVIGTGGMGEVYEVEDLTMQDHLALKTLRGNLAGDTALTTRFRRELRISRQISHPNVCRVSEFYQTEYEPGTPIAFFTMELLKGETLAHRITAKGRFTQAEALPIIRQVAAGLAEVHSLGIVHRDLKPANIMLMNDLQHSERAVLMDFGLARSIQPGVQSDTRVGTVMGTPFYMAPEQFTGGQVTAACDIYAFGVTIFEMLTGKPHPLAGLRSSCPGIDAAWERTLLRCFDGDPAKRPSSPHEVVTGLAGKRSAQFLRMRRLAATLAIVLALAASYVAIWKWLAPVPQPPPVITRLTSDNGFTTDPAFSQDGKLLVYASDRGARGDLNIWSQHMETGEYTQLTDDPGNEDEPAISPDGKLVAYHSQRDETLYVKPVGGGPARAIARWGQNPEFSPDGAQIAYWTGQESDYTAPSGHAWVVGISGGQPREVGADFTDARYPVWAPDGRRILFRGAQSSQPSFSEQTDWWTVDAAGGEAIATGAGAILRSAGLMPQGSPPVWDGKKIIFSGTLGHTTNLWSINLSESRLRATGALSHLTTGADRDISPVLLSDGRVAYSNWRFSSHIWRLSLSTEKLTQITDGDLTDAQPSVSEDGRFLVFWRYEGDQRNVIWKNLETQTERSLFENEPATAYLSPDGKTIAYSLGNDVYFQRIPSKSSVLACRGCGQVVSPTPDGQGVLTHSTLAHGAEAIDWIDLESSSRHLVASMPGLTDAAISPKIDLVALTIRQEGVLSRIYLARLTGGQVSGTMVPVTPADSPADNPVWSEDGRQLYYASDRDGFSCIWRQPIDPVALRLVGREKAVYHFHRVSFSPYTMARSAFRLTLARNSLFLNIGSVQANLWILKP